MFLLFFSLLFLSVARKDSVAGWQARDAHGIFLSCCQKGQPLSNMFPNQGNFEEKIQEQLPLLERPSGESNIMRMVWGDEVLIQTRIFIC